MKLAAVVDDTSEINLQEDSRSVTQRTRREKASSMVQKSLKELRVMRRRVAFGWRHLKAGVLVFQDGGGQRRTFAVGKKLGEGGYSTIWRVHEWQPDGSEWQCAVKRIILDRKDEEQVALVEHEIKVMRSLPPHPNVLELIGTCSRKRGASGTQDETFLLLELCRGGSLAERLLARSEEGAAFSVGECGRAFYDMASALAHLHAQPQPLAHRDVKPENFIFSEADGRWRLCDFGSSTTTTFQHAAGMASYVVANEEDKIHRYSTPQYRAPEMCDPRRGELIGTPVDVWALGVSLYKLLFLRDLFGTAGEERLAILNFDPANKLAPDALPPRRGVERGDDAEQEQAGLTTLLETLRGCLTPRASSRPTVIALLQTLASHAAQLRGTGAFAWWDDCCYGRGGYLAGQLTLSQLRARGIYPKSVSGGVKTYLLITSGGSRRLTQVAPRGLDASWTVSIALSTHARRPVEVTLWAAHRRATHDFMGGLVLDLPTLLHSPFEPARVELDWTSLQRRSHRSRVSGQFACSLQWKPYSQQPPTTALHASANSGRVAASSAAPPSPPLLIDGLGSSSSAAAASSQPAAPMGTFDANFGVGSFWDSPAAATSAAPRMCAGSSSPPRVIFEPSDEQLFASVDTHAAPWEVVPGGAAAADQGPGSFWASFDASPALPLEPSQPLQSSQQLPPLFPPALAPAADWNRASRASFATPSDDYMPASFFAPALAPAAADRASRASFAAAPGDPGASIIDWAAAAAPVGGGAASANRDASVATSVFNDLDDLFRAASSSPPPPAPRAEVAAVAPAPAAPHASPAAGGAVPPLTTSNDSGSFWDTFGSG